MKVRDEIKRLVDDIEACRKEQGKDVPCKIVLNSEAEGNGKRIVIKMNSSGLLKIFASAYKHADEKKG